MHRISNECFVSTTYPCDWAENWPHHNCMKDPISCSVQAPTYWKQDVGICAIVFRLSMQCNRTVICHRTHMAHHHRLHIWCSEAHHSIGNSKNGPILANIAQIVVAAIQPMLLVVIHACSMGNTHPHQTFPSSDEISPVFFSKNVSWQNKMLKKNSKK